MYIVVGRTSLTLIAKTVRYELGDLCETLAEGALGWFAEPRDGSGEAEMGRSRIGQGSLAEALLPAGVGCNHRLERIVGLIDRAPIARLLAPLRAPTGRPGYLPLALFRALLLAQWYQLSDPGLEEALADRL